MKKFVMLFVLCFLAGMSLTVYMQFIPRYPELMELSSSRLTFEDLNAFFARVAMQKGAAYAYELLKFAPISPNAHMHTLGHTIGDILWKQEGEKGIFRCRQDINNACSHSIVAAMMREQGEGAFDRILTLCRQSPGGEKTYHQCLHGVGHGMLAVFGYDLGRAVNLCQKADDVRGKSDCVGGVIMELVSGGQHDQEAYQDKGKQYLSSADPLAPCSTPGIADAIKPGCYEYLTVHLMVTAGATLEQLSSQFYEPAMRMCDAIPPREKENRAACYGGFGREFVTLAQGKTYQRDEHAIDAQLENVAAWCLLAKDTDGIDACAKRAVEALQFNGSSQSNNVERFCQKLPERYQRSCLSS